MVDRKVAQLVHKQEIFVQFPPVSLFKPHFIFQELLQILKTHTTYCQLFLSLFFCFVNNLEIINITIHQNGGG